MTVWVIRNGVLVKKGSMQEARNDKRSIFPTPRLSTSWSQRDKDLRDSNSYDPRDVSHERPKPKQLSLPFDRA
jgi:hypothetical protein